MSSDPQIRQEMIALLGRIVGPGPLPDDLRRHAMQLFATLLEDPSARATQGNGHPSGSLASGLTSGAGGVALAAPAVGNRRLVYVHGICQHGPGFSDSWWNSLRDFVPTAFGEGALGSNRLEVIWSPIVNQVAAQRALMAAAPTPAGLPSEERQRRETAEEIKETLRDRADQQVLNATPPADPTNPQAALPLATPAPQAGLLNIPLANCIDDFSVYLINSATRQEILDCFTTVVRPLLQAGNELDIIGHSWGTVVAYEGLRQLEDEGFSTPLVRNFFTLGSALSIGTVKRHLRPANRDGRKPASVKRWINIDARGDVVGGPLQGRPYAVDLDFVNLTPVGCNTFGPLVTPTCAHSSYFVPTNLQVNRDILAFHIN
jgi:hypothetical protein